MHPQISIRMRVDGACLHKTKDNCLTILIFILGAILCLYLAEFICCIKYYGWHPNIIIVCVLSTCVGKGEEVLNSEIFLPGAILQISSKSSSDGWGDP